MLVIDKYSYVNRLRNVSPKLKICYSFSLIVLSLMIDYSFMHLFIVALNTFLIVGVAKINLRSYVKLLLIPMVFILFSIVSVVMQLSTKELSEVIVGYRIMKLSIGITNASVSQGILLFTRSIAAITSSYFILLTTPMIDLIKFLKFLKLPNEMIEIMVLTYKFIFVLLEESKKIYEAQLMRNGYKNLKNSFQSIGILIRMIFINTLNRYKKMQETLEIRQFTGEFYI